MTHDYDEIDHAYEAEQAEELATFLSDINPDTGEPLTARDRAVWATPTSSYMKERAIQPPRIL